MSTNCSMLCELYFFYGQQTTLKRAYESITQIAEPYQIITNSFGLNEFLGKHDVKSVMLDKLVPDEGPVGEEVYHISKSLHNEYKRIFADLTFSGFEIFKGFEYPLLRQLIFLNKCGKVLDGKKNTIFIFEGFSYIYPAIMKLALELGYSTDLKIGFIKSSGIEYMKFDYKTDSDNRNKFSFLRSSNFLKSSSDNYFSLANLKSFSYFISKILSLIVRKLLYRFLIVVKIEPVKIILNKVDKKIKRTSSRYDAVCAYFITATRADIYLRPWYSVMKKFSKEKLPVHIFTSDLATSLVLSKEGLSFVSLFEEVNILMEELKKSDFGKEIEKKIKLKVDQNSSLRGIAQLSSYLSSNIFRSVSIIIICEYIVKRMKLKSIVAVADGEMLENLAIEACKKFKITSVSMVPAVVNPLPIFRDWFHADRICVYGSQGLEALSSFGYAKERIILTGTPKYDYFKTLDPIKSKAILQENTSVNSEKKLVVIGMSVWREGDEDWISDFIKFCNKNNFEIIIKLHPKYKESSHEMSETKIKIISERCKNLKYFITYDMELPLLLSASDVVITDYSNVGIDAVLLGKPLISVNFLRELWDDYPQRIDKFGASIYVEEYLKLKNIILEVLNENKHVAELKKGREKVVSRFNFYNDGKASDRIFDLLMKP